MLVVRECVGSFAEKEVSDRFRGQESLLSGPGGPALGRGWELRMLGDPGERNVDLSQSRPPHTQGQGRWLRVVE